jgi:hypothetical protein
MALGSGWRRWGRTAGGGVSSRLYQNVDFSMADLVVPQKNWWLPPNIKNGHTPFRNMGQKDRLKSVSLAEFSQWD